MKNNKLKQKKALYINGIFIISLVGIFFFLGLHKVFFSAPGGIHFMRQTDSLSFVAQYFNNGFNFFKPQLFNLKNIDGRAACEFPIIYYITALLYAIIGQKVFLLKLLHLIIAYTGVYFIFKMSYLLLKDYFYAVFISLFLFSSTVFNYYAFNYLPDIAALGFTFIAWYYIIKYQYNTTKKALFFSFLFFTLASLIKVTYLINPIALILYFALHNFFKEKKSILKFKNVIFYSILGFSIVLFWNMYMLYYNKLYGGLSFNTSAFPIWSLSFSNIHLVWKHIVNDVYVDYFAAFLYYLISFLILLQLFYYKRVNKKLSGLIFILFIGVLAYFLLFYSQFKDHDYYFLAFAPLVIFILINGFTVLQTILKKKFTNIAIKIVLLSLIIIGINDSKAKLAYRHWNLVDDYSRTGLLINENIKAINKLNIPADAKFIVAPDFCQNGGLYFLNRIGWNIEHYEQITFDKISIYEKKGAEYLLLVGNNENMLKVAQKCGNSIYRNKEISIYQLKNGE